MRSGQASTACSTLACSILNVNVRYLESCAQVRVPNSKSGLPDWPFLGPDCSNLAPFNFAWTPKNILALWSFLDLFDNYNVIMLFTSLLLRELQKIVKYNSDFSTVSRYLAPKSRIWTLFWKNLALRQKIIWQPCSKFKKCSRRFENYLFIQFDKVNNIHFHILLARIKVWYGSYVWESDLEGLILKLRL